MGILSDPVKTTVWTWEEKISEKVFEQVCSEENW
jgi:hypothetical protein